MTDVRLALCVCLCVCVSYTTGLFASNQCLNTGAFFNNTVKVCQCEDGYTGLGDLCCDSNDDWKVCTLMGDPILTTYDGTKNVLGFPCVSRVARVSGKTRNGDACQVEVMNSGIVVENGVIYPDRISVVFRIAGGGPQVFRIVKDTFQRPGDASPYPSSALYSQRLFRPVVAGEMILIAYVNSRKIWSVIGCNVKVTFRAAQSNKAIQDYRPGLCVAANKDTTPSSDDVCSASAQTEAERKSLHNRLLVSSIETLSSVDPESKAIHPDYAAPCSSLEASAAACGPNLTTFVANNCGGLLHNGDIRLCMTLRGVSGPDILDFVSKCAKFHCQRDFEGCKAMLAGSDALKACIPTLCDP